MSQFHCFKQWNLEKRNTPELKEGIKTAAESTFSLAVSR